MIYIFGLGFAPTNLAYGLALELAIVHLVTMRAKHRHLWRALLYTACLLLILLNPQGLSYGKICLDFRFTERAIVGFLSNILLFVPIGYYWYLTLAKKSTILISVMASIAVEFLQLLVFNRVFDIMDIVAYIIAIPLGALLSILVSRILRRRDDIQDQGSM